VRNAPPLLQMLYSVRSERLLVEKVGYDVCYDI
jgi:hypothetical protein